MMLPGSTLLLAVTGDSSDPEFLGSSDGDPDEIAVPINNTLAPTSWARYPTAQVLLTLQGGDGAPYYYEPRNVLSRVLAKFAELDLRAVVAFELEFYLCDSAHDNGKQIRPPKNLRDARGSGAQVYNIEQVEIFADYLHEVTEACAQQNIKCGAISSEYAPGQFEINLTHGDPLIAADQCVLFRRTVQCVAAKHNLCATFMAKPYAEFSGNGLHLHISLLDADGANIFDNGDDCNDAAPTLLNAIGGMQKIMPEAMAIFAPNVNSYHRFTPDSYVPVQPNWGFDNRSAAMRIPKGLGHARRIEHRVAGADANPYLTLAALLAGVHYGIVNRIQPDPPTHGNAGNKLHPNIPFDLVDANAKFRQGKILSDYFGQRYVNAYCSCKLNEYEAFIKSGEAEASWYL